jgi:hypothetical protein
MIADLVAEKYGKSFTDKTKSNDVVERKKRFRVFCRKDLVTTKIDIQHNIEKIDIDSERKVFEGDDRLQQLFNDLVTDKAQETDWKGRRPGYISRVHENVISREEFVNLESAIKADEARDYLKEKSDMNDVVERHLKNRNR